MHIHFYPPSCGDSSLFHHTRCMPFPSVFHCREATTFGQRLVNHQWSPSGHQACGRNPHKDRKPGGKPWKMMAGKTSSTFQGPIFDDLFWRCHDVFFRTCPDQKQLSFVVVLKLQHGTAGCFKSLINWSVFWCFHVSQNGHWGIFHTHRSIPIFISVCSMNKSKRCYSSPPNDAQKKCHWSRS